jgi:phage-related protein
MLKVELLQRGRSFDLYALKVDDQCLVTEYVSSLPDSVQKQIVALFDFVLEKGTPRNKEKFRSIGGKIYELKTPMGARILCFFGGSILPNSLILTHGFNKPKPKQLNREKKKAVNWMMEITQESKEIKSSRDGVHHEDNRKVVQRKIRLLQRGPRVPT